MLAVVVLGFAGVVDRTVTWMHGVDTATVEIDPSGAGRDFALNIWIPVRALVDGQDPYSPTDRTVFKRYHNAAPASFYAPSILLLLAPLALLPISVAVVLMAALSYLLIWFALLVVMEPGRRSPWWALGLVGTLVTLGSAASQTFMFGQPSACFMLGFALLARSLDPQRARTAPYAVASVVLLCEKPQFAIPAVIVFAAIGQWRSLTIGILLTALLSIPFSILEVVAAGGFAAAVRSVARGTQFVNGIVQTGGRTDLLNWVSDGAHHGLGLEAVVLLLFSVVLIAAVRWAGIGQPDRLTLLCLATGFALTAVYHHLYDMLVLAVPAAVALTGDSQRLRRTWQGDLALMYLFLGLLTVPALFEIHSRRWTTGYDNHLAPLLCFALFLSGVVGLAMAGRQRRQTGRPTAPV